MIVDLAVGLSGRIGSGKTSLSSELANRIGCQRASFGDYVRSLAQSMGLDPNNRTILQDLGEEMISDGWTRFVRAVLEHAGYTSGPIVIDGIRHLRAIDALRSVLAPIHLVIVAVEVGGDLRRRRLRERGLEEREARAADGHVNESEVAAVMAAADLILPSDTTVEDAAVAVLEWLESNASPGRASGK